MILSKIQISNFRNFKRKAFSFSPKTTVIIGPNTSGKTNIFEAIFLLATGKSFKAQIEEEMISYGQEIARVSGDFSKPKQKLEVVLTRGEITIGQTPEKTERVQRKRLLYRIREEGASRGQLLFWDRLLIKNGDYISQKREEFIDFTNDKGKLNDQDFSLDYDKSAISEARLEQYAEEDVAAATTLVGPHRDDFVVKLK